MSDAPAPARYTGVLPSPAQYPRPAHDRAGLVVLVCGGRHYWRRAVVWGVLDALLRHRSVARVVVGGADGADALAADWARGRGLSLGVYPADWATYRRAAGPIRNGQMIAAERPDVVVAFPGGPGTRDMTRQAQAAGVRVVLAPSAHHHSAEPLSIP